MNPVGGSASSPTLSLPTLSRAPRLPPAPESRLPGGLSMMAEATTVAGLFLDIVGVVLLYFFAPEKIPDPQTKACFRIKAEVRKTRVVGMS